MSVEQCRSCKKPVVWVVTKNGKSMPVDAESATEDERKLFGIRPEHDPKRHISHFATCPQSKDWRKSR